MINMTFLYAAYVIIGIVLFREILLKCTGVDINKIDVFSLFTKKIVISKTTGTKSLKLVNSGDNKATVMATLRNITGLNYQDAKTVVNSAPTVFMKGISYKEADLTKQALEFVGAKVEIK